MLNGIHLEGRDVQGLRASDWAEGLPSDLKNTQEPLWETSVDDPQHPDLIGECRSTYSQFQFLRAEVKFWSIEHLLYD